MDKKKLVQLARTIETYQTEAQATAVEVKEALDHAAEDDHLHKAAFKAAHRLWKMEAGPRSDFLRAFDEYRMQLGLDDQADLLDQANAA